MAENMKPKTDVRLTAIRKLNTPAFDPQDI